MGTDPPVVEKSTGLRMDPRIARRWVEVRREEGRRRLRVLTAIGAVVLTLALLAGSLYTPIFRVRHVRVTVHGALSSSKVATLSGISHHTLMIRVNDSSVRRRLDAVANLGQATVATHWPGTVSISVVVREPIAIMPTASATTPTPGAQWAEIDATGRVIAVVPVRPAGLPVLSGIDPPPALGQWLTASPGPSATIPRDPRDTLVDMNAASATDSVPTGVAALLAVALALPQQIRESVGTMSSSASSGLTITVAATQGSAGPITVELGDGSELAAKLTAMTTLLTQANLAGANAIDLTVPDRPVALTVQKTPYSLSTHAGGSH